MTANPGDGPGPRPPSPAAVVVRARRAFFIVAPLTLGAMLVRANVLTDGGGLGLLPFAVVAIALFLGCLTYAALTSWGVGGFLEPIAWMVAGAVSCDAMVALVFLVLPTDVGDQALARSIEFWAFWGVAGGITGLAYWMIAQDRR